MWMCERETKSDTEQKKLRAVDKWLFCREVLLFYSLSSVTTMQFYMK